MAALCSHLTGEIWRERPRKYGLSNTFKYKDFLT